MKRREVAAMSKLYNLTSWKKRGEQDNNVWQTFPDDLPKSEQHDIAQLKLSVYPGRFYGDDKTLKRRVQAFVYSEYPWIEYSIKEDVPACFCCELPFLGKRDSVDMEHFIVY